MVIEYWVIENGFSFNWDNIIHVIQNQLVDFSQCEYKKIAQPSDPKDTLIKSHLLHLNFLINTNLAQPNQQEIHSAFIQQLNDHLKIMNDIFSGAPLGTEVNKGDERDLNTCLHPYAEAFNQNCTASLPVQSPWTRFCANGVSDDLLRDIGDAELHSIAGTFDAEEFGEDFELSMDSPAAHDADFSGTRRRMIHARSHRDKEDAFRQRDQEDDISTKQGSPERVITNRRRRVVTRQQRLHASFDSPGREDDGSHSGIDEHSGTENKESPELTVDQLDTFIALAVNGQKPSKEQQELLKCCEKPSWPETRNLLPHRTREEYSKFVNMRLRARNTVHARDSRVRRSKRLDSLEKQNQILENEKAKLVNENRALEKQVQQLTLQNSLLTQALAGTPQPSSVNFNAIDLRFFSASTKGSHDVTLPDDSDRDRSQSPSS